MGCWFSDCEPENSEDMGQNGVINTEIKIENLSDIVAKNNNDIGMIFIILIIVLSIELINFAWNIVKTVIKITKNKERRRHERSLFEINKM